MDILYYIFGPRLYMDYNVNSEQMLSLAALEKTGDYLWNMMMILMRICLLLSPIYGPVIYRYHFIPIDIFYFCLKALAAVCFVFLIAACFRVLGRYQSESYRHLISALKQAKSGQNPNFSLKTFDFDFRWWPVDFDVRSLKIPRAIPPRLDECSLTPGDFLYIITTYFFVRYIGIWLLYPGCIQLLQSYLRPSLVEGRAELILKRNGRRFKVRTADRNEIDTIFIDNRGRSKNGNTLIINSEGNMSFYEIGVMNTNVSRSYSMLGWNHPGFEGSSGCPFPKQEFHAIDAVIKFAIYKLNFDETDIMLYGWSIGGFCTSAAATKYSNLKGVILDGTFDDILNLAYEEIPFFLHKFIRISVRCHCNLHNSELLKSYSGPILIIRRIYDETISPDSRLESNRTNHLILKVVQHRYPNIFQESQMQLLWGTLIRPLGADVLTADENAECWTRLLNHVAAEGKEFPMTIGGDYNGAERNKMAYFLIRKYCRDFRSSHCPPLEIEYFQIPWDGFSKASS